MANNKPLRELSSDEIAQLTPEQFKELADNHNDELELRENGRNREIEQLRTLTNEDLAKEIEALRSKANWGLRVTPEQDRRHTVLTDERERRIEAGLDPDKARVRNELVEKFSKLPTQEEHHEKYGAAQLTDKDLSHEIYRLEVLVNHPDHEISEDDVKRLEAMEHEENRREQLKMSPDNPLNYPDARKFLTTDQRLTPEQREQLKHDKPLTGKEQIDILQALEQSPGGYGSVSRLPDPDQEIDQVLSELVKPREKKPLLERLIDRVKQVPENIRARTVDFTPLLDHRDQDMTDDHERENSLDDGDPRRW